MDASACHIAAILRPLYARIVQARLGDGLDRAVPARDPADATAWQPAGDAYCERLLAELRQHAAAPAPAKANRIDLADGAAYLDAIRDLARDEPGTVAQARALLADPRAALGETAAERQVAWLVALADLHHRRAGAARIGGTAA